MRPIDADALRESLTETLHRCDEWIENAKDGETRTIAEANYTAFLESILRVKDAPTIDAVPVVRCKDCKWYVRSIIKQDGTLDERYKPDWCDLYRRVREETYFCADGERKDDETDRR